MVFSLLAIMVCFYTALNVLYIALFAFAGYFSTTNEPKDTPIAATFRRIAVLIPAYREDGVIVQSVLANLKQTYPAEAYDLVVIADSFQPATLARLGELPIQVVEVGFEVPTIAKALLAGLQRLSQKSYDIVVIADADNVMAADFLERVNVAFEQGADAVQGHRVAKNTNTTLAVLDAISEEVNNHIFRKGHKALGISPSLIGSGMAFRQELLERFIQQTEDIGGYDKGLDLYIRELGLRIAYLEYAYIYDEKVQTGKIFEHQRTRWMEAHLYYLRKYFSKGVAALFEGRFDYGDKAVQLFVMPRLLLVGLLTICWIGGLLLGVRWFSWAMGIQWVIAVGMLLLSTPKYLFKLLRLDVIIVLPTLFFLLIRSSINFRRARNRFLHTPHGIDTMLFDENDSELSTTPSIKDSKLIPKNHK